MALRQIDGNGHVPATETMFRHQVEQLCDELELWHLHVPDSRRVAPGWVDLVIIGPGGVIFRELKGPEGSRSPWQVYVLRSLLAACCDAGTWRPKDWDSGLIRDTLTRLSSPLTRACPK